MPTFITLINWTDQGIRSYQDTTQRADQFAAAVQKLDVTLTNLYWTVGPYDIVGIVEAPDEETATAAFLQVGSQGNVRTTTMRAFTRDEMDRIIARSAG